MEKKPVGFDFFAGLTYPGQLRAGPGGRLSFVTKTPDLERNRYDATLWLWAGGEPEALTAPGPLAGHWWAGPDTLVLARGAAALPEGDPDLEWAGAGRPFTLLQTLRLDGPGEARPLARLYQEVEDCAALPDGRLVLLARSWPAAEAALAEAGGDSARAAEALAGQDDYEVLEELPFWENGGGFIAGRRRRLYLLAPGGRAEPLTDTDCECANLAPAPDGRHIWYTARRYRAKMPVDDRLFRLDPATGGSEEFVVKTPFRHDAVVPLAGGEVLVAGSGMHAHGLNENPGFYRLDPAAGAVRTLYEGHAYSPGNAMVGDLLMAGPARWQAEGTALYWNTTLGESSHLMRLDTAGGAITQITGQPGAVAELARLDGRTAIVAMRGLSAPEVWLVDDDGAETQLTHFNDEVTTAYALAAPQPLACTVDGCREIRGFVLLPPGMPAGARCPAVLDIHGGPKAAYGPLLVHEMQLWAARGWAVVYCNPTGSDGRGDEFADLRGHMGTVDYADLMGFLDAALAAFPALDPERLGVTGGSYGGFMTNWIIGQTDRFKVAAAQRGIANWGTLSSLSDIGYYFGADMVGATVWSDPAEVWKQSPLKYAGQVKTPTLFIHSEEDCRCPPAEGLQMLAALLDFGVPSRLCLFRGENHELSRSGKPKHRVRRLEEITAWFERYL
jgi:dipeptidyl aminopeptidase/acylaminoacyl peptidase